MPRCQGKVFDYLEYFQQNKVFADAFENYEHLMDVDRYKIYRRKKQPLTDQESLPLAHHLGAHRLGDLVDVGHLEHARGDQDDLAAAHQVAACRSRN